MIGEYAVVIAMVLAVLTAMTVYFKRVLQGRIYDVRNYMVNEVRTRTEGEYSGNLYLGYEPYYTKTDTNAWISGTDETRILPSGRGTPGIFQKYYDETTAVRTAGETLSPRYYNATTPPSGP